MADPGTGACPRCGAALLASGGIHVCPERHDAFVPDARLRGHEDADRLRTGTAPAWILCPSCGTLMQEVPGRTENLLLDRCSGCGGWSLDRGELEALRAALPTQPNNARATWWRSAVEALLHTPWFLR